MEKHGGHCCLFCSCYPDLVTSYFQELHDTEQSAVAGTRLVNSPKQRQSANLTKKEYKRKQGVNTCSRHGVDSRSGHMGQMEHKKWECCLQMLQGFPIHGTTKTLPKLHLHCILLCWVCTSFTAPDADFQGIRGTCQEMPITKPGNDF